MPAWDDVRPSIRRRPSRAGHDAVGIAEFAQTKTELAPLAATTYRREARRLRQRYASQPELLHSSLRDLSRKHDRANRAAGQSVEAPAVRRVRPVIEQLDEVIAAPPAVPSFGHAVVNWFADRVAATVDSRLLLFSERHALLKTAQRLGIDRFHANLIVAVAQHQAEERGDAQTTPATSESPRKWSLAPVLLVLVVQTLIVTAGWWMLR